MKKSLFIYLGSFWITLVLIVLAPLTLMAQEVTLHKQRAFPKTVSAGNYSGIAWLGGSKYAIANDKSPTAGFYLMTIETDSLTGALLAVREDTFLTCGLPNRDEEGICYMPQTQTVFVSGEKDQEILEYNLQGQETDWFVFTSQTIPSRSHSAPVR